MPGNKVQNEQQWLLVSAAAITMAVAGDWPVPFVMSKSRQEKEDSPVLPHCCPETPTS
jgi:hypothetical protein